MNVAPVAPLALENILVNLATWDFVFVAEYSREHDSSLSMRTIRPLLAAMRCQYS
jgi:hypothetical protein